MNRIKFYCFVGLTLIAFLTTVTAQAATIKGVVTYDGKVPKFREIKMDADPACLMKHGGNLVYPQVLLLGEELTMGNVFVHISNGVPKKGYTPVAEPIVLDQRGCMYTPHVAGVMVGQPVKILNPDGTLHNVHAMSKINPEFNLAMPKFRKETTKTFKKPEFMFAIKCDVHPWMSAWLSVMDHPYFYTTEVDGQYMIENLPAGNYEIEAWHEKLGPRTVTVCLAEGETKEVDFTFSRPSKKK